MTTEPSATPVLRSYLTMVRRRRWWIAGAALLGLAAGIGLSFLGPKEYSATAQLLVQPSAASLAFGGSADTVTPTVVQTDVELVTSAPVRRAVSRLVGAEPLVAVSEVAQTNVIEVTAVSQVPARAAQIANAYARAFVSYQQTAALDSLAQAQAQLRKQIRALDQQVRALKRQRANLDQLTARLDEAAVERQQLAQMQVEGAVANTGGVEFITPAQPPAAPSSPRPGQDVLLGLAAGLVVGLAVALTLESLDDTVASKEVAERLSGSPVLAMVPAVASWKRRDRPVLASVSDPLSPAAEAYRSLRTSLQFARQGRELRTLLVTSPAAAEGKTSTIANLGVMFAQAGERVVLASCDLRRPRLGEFFGLDEGVGLTSVLGEGTPLQAAIQQVAGVEGLWLLGSGRIPQNPAELLSGAEAGLLFGWLREQFDLVLIDSPPVLPVTDAAVLSRQADAVLIVVAAGQTKRVEIQRAAERVRQGAAAMLGVVMNEVTRQVGYGSGDGYGYGYGYGYAPRADRAVLGTTADLAPGIRAAKATAGGRAATGRH